MEIVCPAAGKDLIVNLAPPSRDAPTPYRLNAAKRFQIVEDMLISFDKRFPKSSNHSYTQRSEPSRFAGPHDRRSGQHWIFRADVSCIPCGLLDGFHLLLTTSVVKRTYYDGLAK